MDTGTPSSTARPAPPSRDEGRRLASYGQLQRGEGSASRLPTQTPATAAPRNARPSGMVAPSRVSTPNRNQRPVSTVTTSSHQRYSVSSYESTTSNFNRFTAGAGAPPNRPTSTASQPEYGDSSYFVWARRHDRLAALQTPVRGHDYAAAGIVRSYHRVPSALRSEGDTASTQSPISSLTESDNASASVRWGNPAGALRHATHAVAPSIHSRAGRIVAASVTTKREDSVAPISRYNRATRPRTYSTPIVPSRPAAGEQRPRTFLDMHDQYERAPAYRPQAQQVEWGSNFSPHSPGYTLEQIRQRRSTISRGFPQPQNIAAEQRIFAGPFVDAPVRITASSHVERAASRDTRIVVPEPEPNPEPETKVGAEEEHKTPGKWRKMSGLFTKKLGRKGKSASPDQISPHSSPSTSHSTPSLVDSPPNPNAKPPVPRPPPAAPHATRAQHTRSLSPLVVLPFRLRPTGQSAIITRDVQPSPISPLSDTDANQGTEGLSPVSPLSEHSSPPDERRPMYSLRAPPLVPGSIQAEQELIDCLSAAAALPRRQRRIIASRRKPVEEVEDVDEEHVKGSLTSERLEQLDEDLFPSPLVVQKRWKRSHSPLSPTHRQSPSYSHNHSHRHQSASAALVGGNARWGNAQEIRVVAKGKGRLVTSRSNSQQQPSPERSRPVVLEAPCPEPKAQGTDTGDEKERRDTTFAGADVQGKGKGEEQEQDENEDAHSVAPSWRTNDSQKFSRGVATRGPRP
jgi:hypothetical protein